MARKAVLEGGKRDEIISAALKLFLENGYEGTSIRMILEQVGGEVGMFYHYFQSKQEVFDKAFELFMKKQGERIALLMGDKSDDITPRKRLEQLEICYENAMCDYSKLLNDNIHWTVISALHEMTLDAMLPPFKEMLIEITRTAGKDSFSEIDLLAPFVLKGISGLIHDQTFLALPKEKKVALIIRFICSVLEIPGSTFEE